MRSAGAALLAGLVLSSCAALERRPTRVCEDPALEAEVVALVRAGIATTEPNTAELVTRGEATLFDGSYDWHSCVLAHWVLCVSARVRGDDELGAWLDGRLVPEALAAESALLLAHDPFGRVTWPYDESWFCLLLVECARRAGDDRFDDLRRLHERRLVEALETLPFPDDHTYVRDPRLADGEPARRPLAGPYCGFYRSWLWCWLALSWCEPLDPDVRERLAALWEERVVPELGALADLEDGHGYDFLWVPALAALGAELAGAPVPYAAPDPEPLPDAVVIATVHVLGVHLSRVWPLAANGDREGRRAYAAARDALVARRDLWAEDFPACSHWVPQYLFLGEWLAAGRP